VQIRGESLPSILGVPDAGQVVGGEKFDGRTEAAIFPGDLPADPVALFAAGAPAGVDLTFPRFRPPALEMTNDGTPALPHIRLDRALQFLIGDRLQ